MIINFSFIKLMWLLVVCDTWQSLNSYFKLFIFCGGHFLVTHRQLINSNEINVNVEKSQSNDLSVWYGDKSQLFGKH